MEHSIIDFILYDDEFNGELNTNAEYQEARSKSNKCYEKLSATLSDEQKKQLIELQDLEYEMQCIHSNNYFRAGVKLGVRFVAECMFD